MAEKIYCGIGRVPKNNRLGTAEECALKRQIRYYGLQKVNLNDIAKGKTRLDKQKEQLKLKKLEDDARYLIKQVNNVKVIIDSDKATARQKKAANKKLDGYYLKRDKLLKDIKKQSKIIKDMEGPNDDYVEEPKIAPKKKVVSKKKTYGSKTNKEAPKTKLSEADKQLQQIRNNLVDRVLKATNKSKSEAIKQVNNFIEEIFNDEEKYLWNRTLQETYGHIDKNKKPSEEEMKRRMNQFILAKSVLQFDPRGGSLYCCGDCEGYCGGCAYCY